MKNPFAENRRVFREGSPEKKAVESQKQNKPNEHAEVMVPYTIQRCSSKAMEDVLKNLGIWKQIKAQEEANREGNSLIKVIRRVKGEERFSIQKEMLGSRVWYQIYRDGFDGNGNFVHGRTLYLGDLAKDGSWSEGTLKDSLSEEEREKILQLMKTEQSEVERYRVKPEQERLYLSGGFFSKTPSKEE